MYLKNSQESRDLPTPAGPKMASSRAVPASAEAWKNSLTSRSSRSRPRKEASSPSMRSVPPTAATTRVARYSGTGAALPLSTWVPASA